MSYVKYEQKNQNRNTENTPCEHAPIISVIIPYYNESKELIERCVNSIIAQTFQDYEVIIIDDGSRNENSEILDKFIASIDPRISIYHRESCGVSSARNYGVSVSRGQYIIFVDSDDIIPVRSLEEAYTIIVSEDADFVVGRMLITKRADICYNEDALSYEVYENKDISILNKYFIGDIVKDKNNGGYLGKGPVARILKKSIAETTPFLENLAFFEDSIWNLDVLLKCNKVCITNHIWYLYCFNEQSTLHRYNPDIIHECEIYLELLQHYVRYDIHDEYLEYTNRIINLLKDNVYAQYLGQKEKTDSFHDRREAVRHIYTKQPWIKIKDSKYIRSAKTKKRIIALLYKYRMFFIAWDIKTAVENLF